MGLKDQHSDFAADINAAHIVPVIDFTPETLRSIVAHLEVSTDFEHLVYREAELDAIWSITGFFLMNEPDSARFALVSSLHEGAHRAHDFIAACRPRDAADVLRNFL